MCKGVLKRDGQIRCGKPAPVVRGDPGLDFVHEHEDRASGKHGGRDQLKQLIAAASRREFDCLLFWSLDRLSREGTVATLNHLQRLTGYGVNYRSFTEQYLDSTGMCNEAVIGILAAVAKQERVRLSERTIAGLQRDRAHGRVGGRPRIEHNHEIVTKAIVNPDGTSHKVTEAKELDRVWLESGVQKQVPEWVLENDHFRMLEAEDSASAVA